MTFEHDLASVQRLDCRMKGLTEHYVIPSAGDHVLHASGGRGHWILYTCVQNEWKDVEIHILHF